MKPDYDVIVIGAGLAGLTAARQLERSNLRVLVIEARDRVGGRNEEVTLGNGLTLEVGGQWIGANQEKMFALCREFDLKLIPTYNEGDNLLYINGKRKRMGSQRGAIPRLNPFVLLDLYRSIKKIDKLSAQIDLTNPWQHTRAREWDGQTLESWINQNISTHRAREYFRVVAEAVFATEASDFSFLHFLFYLKSGQDLETLISVEKGAQEYRVAGGTQQISRCLAGSLQTPVLLDSPVVALSQTDEGVTVQSAAQDFTARKVVVSLPPTLAGRLHYDPPLPALRDQLTQRVPAGSVIKSMAIYKEPFWRQDGLTGQAASFEGPVKITFDNSPEDGSYGVLLGFLEGADGRQAAEWTAAQRQQEVLACFARYFGKEALSPLEYLEKDWMAEPYTRGCYGGHFSPGVWTAYGPYLRQPCGHIHWAGAETADIWNGYMEGAVRSGERVAGEIVATLDQTKR